MNEMKDWLHDSEQEAQWWISRYPFLEIKDNSVYPWLEIGSKTEHWLSDLPQGWIDGFCKQMCDELMEALGDYADKWIIVQVKEKYGELRIYHAGLPKGIYDKVEDVIDKYRDISYYTCCECGSPATQWSGGYILPYCDKCAEKRK